MREKEKIQLAANVIRRNSRAIAQHLMTAQLDELANLENERGQALAKLRNIELRQAETLFDALR